MAQFNGFYLKKIVKMAYNSLINAWLDDMFPLPDLGQLHEESRQELANNDLNGSVKS